MLQNNVEAVSAFDGGVVEADNLHGLQNTCGNKASSCSTINPQHKRWEMRRSCMPEIWPRRPKAAHNETGGVGLKCVRRAIEKMGSSASIVQKSATHSRSVGSYQLRLD